jgi:hypothetical protein
MNEAYLTGEPFEIAKTPGSEVLSGAINGDAALHIRAEKLAVDSRYARIMQVMQDAEQRRPRIRRLGDKLGAWYKDNLEVAQFIYLLLSNPKVRHVIDTITSKVVLILGRFTPERKAVLDAIRKEIHKRDYVPVLFDFDKPASKDFTGTVSTLANMARFIIADLTDPASVPHELRGIAPDIVVPIQTIILKGHHEYAMFLDLKKRYHWVLEPYQYNSLDSLLAQLNERVIAPAEAKAIELRVKVAGAS